MKTDLTNCGKGHHHAAVYPCFSVTLKGATSQVAGSPAVLDRTVVVLDRIVIVLDRSVIAICGILSLNFLRLGGGSDRLWLLRAVRHTSAPALPTLSILSGDRYVKKTLALRRFVSWGPEMHL